MSKADAFSLFESRGVQVHELDDLNRTVRRPVLAGCLIVFGCMGSAAVWGSTVRIPAGAAAPGVVSPDTNRKTVQHFEGGIVSSLMVREGDPVETGDTLITLESIQASTTHEAVLGRYRTLLIMKARLEAEQGDLATFEVPADVDFAPITPELKTIIRGQASILQARASFNAANKAILEQRIAQSHEHIAALAAQAESAVMQITLIDVELRGKEQLSLKGIIPKPELLKLQRLKAELAGRHGEYIGTIAKIGRQIQETKTQMLAEEAKHADQIATQMDQVRLELSNVKEKLTASRDVLTRTAVLAPVAGRVVNMSLKTIGGVVRAGEPIMDIVPSGDKLFIDARIAPNDVDIVKAGLPAIVQLTAFANRGLPRIAGTVRTVSADRLQDTATTSPYFLARVEVDRVGLERWGGVVNIVPGMPADILVVTTERSLIEYLIEPIRQAFRPKSRENRV